LIARCFSKNQELETFVGFLGFLGKLMGLIKMIQKHNKRVFKVQKQVGFIGLGHCF
jgi:hypothetical protein